MSAHIETICTVVGTGIGVISSGYVGVKKLTKSLNRVGDMIEDFRGSPADPARGLLTAKPGVMTQLSSLFERTDALDRGQLRILDDLKQINQRLNQTRNI